MVKLEIAMLVKATQWMCSYISALAVCPEDSCIPSENLGVIVAPAVLINLPHHLISFVMKLNFCKRRILHLSPQIWRRGDVFLSKLRSVSFHDASHSARLRGYRELVENKATSAPESFSLCHSHLQKYAMTAWANREQWISSGGGCCDAQVPFCIPKWKYHSQKQLFGTFCANALMSGIYQVCLNITELGAR